MATIYSFDGIEGPLVGLSAGNLGSAETTIVRTGGYSIKYLFNANQSGGYQLMGRAVTGHANQALAVNSAWTGAAFRFAARPTGSGVVAILAVRNSTTTSTALSHASVRINSSGILELWNDSVPELVATGTTALALDEWHYIELFASNSTVGGDWEVWANGVQEILATPGSYATTVINSAIAGKLTEGGGGNSLSVYVDDMVVSDYRTGAIRVYKLPPVADGTYSDFGAGTGSGDYQEVDDFATARVTDSDTTYLTSSTYLSKHSVSCLSMDDAGIASGVDILSVESVAGTIRDEGTTLSAKGGILSGGTETLVPREASGSYVYRIFFYDTDPNTSAAWTRSAVDAAEPLIQHNQNAVRALRITAMALMVAVRESSSTTHYGSASEVAEAFDAALGRMILVGSTSESAEAFSAAVGLAVLSGSASGLAEALAAATGRSVLRGAASEAAAAAAAASGRAILVGSRSDAAVVVDVATGRMVVVGSGTEAVAGYDTALGRMILRGSASVVVVAVDSATGILIATLNPTSPDRVIELLGTDRVLTLAATERLVALDGTERLVALDGTDRVLALVDTDRIIELVGASRVTGA